MPEYVYRAITREGVIVKNRVESGNKQSLVKRLKEVSSQVVLTTHNTTLLDNDLIRPDCGFKISESGITSLHNSTSKDIRLAHNLEKMYRAGSFEWVQT